MKYIGNAIPEPDKGIKVPGPDKCVPDDALSLEEILERFLAGEAVEVGMPVDYDENAGVDINRLDLSEQHSYLVDLDRKLNQKQESQETAESQEKNVSQPEQP
nr:MAG TPA: hypothetical protein [Microviridae sp.]